MEELLLKSGRRRQSGDSMAFGRLPPDGCGDGNSEVHSIEALLKEAS